MITKQQATIRQGARDLALYIMDNGSIEPTSLYLALTRQTLVTRRNAALYMLAAFTAGLWAFVIAQFA